MHTGSGPAIVVMSYVMLLFKMGCTPVLMEWK